MRSRPAHGVAHGGEGVEFVVDDVEQRREFLIEALARPGGGDAARGALQQLDMQAVFDAANAMAQRRL